MIVSFEQLGEIRREHRADKLVFRGGCFDILHPGHIDGLSFAKSLGDLLVVGVVSDIRVAQRKGLGRPTNNETDRLTVVDAIKPVDFSFLMPVTEGDGMATRETIANLQPDIFVDQVIQAHRWQSSLDFFTENGVEVVWDHRNDINSTTDIINRIRGLQSDENTA